MPITLGHPWPSLCEDKNTKSDVITLEAQLQLRVSYTGERLNEAVID